MPWRRRPKKDAATRRNCSGEALAAWEPEVSEWGNPPRGTWVPAKTGGNRGN